MFDTIYMYSFPCFILFLQDEQISRTIKKIKADQLAMQSNVQNCIGLLQQAQEKCLALQMENDRIRTEKTQEHNEQLIQGELHTFSLFEYKCKFMDAKKGCHLKKTKKKNQ